MRKIWISGSRGHMGQALSAILNTMEYQLLLTDKDSVDITVEDDVMRFMNSNRPDVVINCSGYNRSELSGQAEIDMAYKVNAVGARNLAEASELIQAKLIQLSTDDVFGARSEVPYNEFDDVSPRNIIGKSKYAGERFVTQLMSRYVIIRSSWIYGIGKDFTDTVLEAAKDERVTQLSVSDQEFAVPTSAAELAKVIAQLIEHEHYGIYHAVCTGGYCSRYDYAREILKLAGMEDKLEIVRKEGEPVCYSVLDNMMLRINGLCEPADWKVTLCEYFEGVRTGQVKL